MRHVIRKRRVFVLAVLPVVSLSLVIAMPVPVHAQELRFVVTGDSWGSDNGVNTAILAEIAQATIDEGADFILFSGDLVIGSPDQATLESQLTKWRDTMQPVYDAGIGVYPCRGNHDMRSKAAWDNVFAGAYALPGNGPSGEENITFSFTVGNVFAVGLDHYVNNSRVNQAWLDAQFASNVQPHVFVFGHEPAFAVLHDDCLDDYPSDRDAFWNSIKAEGARTYFCGHDHMYNHALIDDGDGNPANDLHQFVVGTSGTSLYDWDGLYDGDNDPWVPHLVNHKKEYGYVLVEVDDSNVMITWKYRVAQGDYAVGNILAYAVSEDVPAVSERGMALIALLLGAAGMVMIERRRTARRNPA